MLRKIVKTVASNFGLKVLAAVFAVILWLVVVNIDDPKINKQYTTSVVIENADYLTNQGKYFQVLNDSNTVVFTVTAKRSYIEKLSSTDFKATADMKNAEIDGTNNTARVPIEVTAVRYSGQVTITKATQNMEISLEDLLQAQFVIGSATTGQLAEGCALGEVTVSPNLLKVSGPESVVSRIDHVTASINVTGVSSDVVDSVIPVLYDTEGNTIDTTDLTINLSTVTVTANVLDTKDVSVIVNVSGTPAEGFDFVDMSIEPETLKIKGTSSALNHVTSITIPATAMDISGTRGDITQTIDVTEYLPKGVTLADPSKYKITATAHIAQQASKTLSIFTSGIQVLNLSDGLTLKFDNAVVRVPIEGSKEAVDRLNGSNVSASVDASGLTEGNHELELILEVEAGVEHARVMVPVTISVGEDVPQQPDDNEPDMTDEPTDDNNNNNNNNNNNTAEDGDLEE